MALQASLSGLGHWWLWGGKDTGGRGHQAEGEVTRVARGRGTLHVGWLHPLTSQQRERTHPLPVRAWDVASERKLPGAPAGNSQDLLSPAQEENDKSRVLVNSFSKDHCSTLSFPLFFQIPIDLDSLSCSDRTALTLLVSLLPVERYRIHLHSLWSQGKSFPFIT